MDLEDTYRSNEDGISYQNDPIRNIASKKWLNSAGASLANLNQIQASVYNIGLVDAKNLRAPSSLSREKRSGSYGDISATPPLSTVSLQQTCNTWGSNQSIPDLIKQHVQPDGTKLQRPESAKYNSARRPRPSSGKKTRPQSATTQESQLPPKPPPGIAVKGAKCDPAGRPPKYSPQQSVTTGWVGPPAGMKFPDVPAQDLSRILTSEPPSPPPPPQGTPAPPPAPRASPIPIPFGKEGEDESLQSQENSVPELRYTQGNIGMTPISLRKPAPEPIHLSLPVMEDEEVDEDPDENMNTDRLLELAEEKSSQLTQSNINSTNNDSTALFNGKTDSLETANHNSEYHHNHLIHNSVKEDHMIVESDGDWSVDEEVEDQPHPLSKSTVTFCEDNNVTIDITPRNMGYKVNDGPNQSKVKKPVIPSETKELQLDLNSLLTVTGTESTGENKESLKNKSENFENSSTNIGNNENKKTAYKNLQKSSSQKLRVSSAKHYSSRYASNMEKCEKIYGMNNRPFSSIKPPKNRPVTPVTTVTVDYGEKEETEKKVRKKKKEKDIVTLVQQVSMSDSDEDKGDDSKELEDEELTPDLLQPWAPTKQISGPVKNYYELSRQKVTQSTPQPKEERKEQPLVYKTTKTIEFDDEMPKETNVKSVIDPVVLNIKEKSNEHLKRPPSRPTSAKVTKRPPVSGACSNDQDRPKSRLGFVPMSPEKESSKSEDETQSNNKKVLKRPVSASINQKRPVSGTSIQKRPNSSQSKEKVEPDKVSSPSPFIAEPSERESTEKKQVEIKDPREIEIDRLIQKHLKRPPTTFKPTIDVFASDLVSDSEDNTENIPDSTTTAIHSNLTAGKMSPKSNHDVTTSDQTNHDVTMVSDQTSHDVTSTLSPKHSSAKSTTATKNKTSTKNKEVSNITLHLDDKVKTLVSDSCAGHKHYASYSRCRSAPTQRKTTQVKEKIRYAKPYYINTLKQYQDDLDTEEGTECALLQAKLAATGINVKAETLQRALYPPTGNSRYYEISAYLPKSQSLGLLSHPKVWLPVEYKQLKLAEKNLEKANEIMRRQKLQEAKEAKLAELAANGANGTKKKKGKKGKGKKKLKTRRNSIS